MARQIETRADKLRRQAEALTAHAAKVGADTPRGQRCLARAGELTRAAAAVQPPAPKPTKRPKAAAKRAKGAPPRPGRAGGHNLGPVDPIAGETNDPGATATTAGA